MEASARENEQKMYENRDRANAAEAKLADTEGRLADAEVRIARLTAQKQHPEITDEAFDALCKETDLTRSSNGPIRMFSSCRANLKRVGMIPPMIPRVTRGNRL